MPISVIVQKEQKQQEYHFRNCGPVAISFHKQSLINLKEYMEELLPNIYDKECVIKGEYGMGGDEDFNIVSNQLKEDIKELTKMIEAYK